MPSDRIPARAILFICVIFLALVIVHLWWSAEVDEPAAPDQQGPRLSSIRIVEGDRVVDLEAEPPAAEGSPQEVLEASLELLGTGSTNERRATAIQLAYMANDPEEHDRLAALEPGLRSRVEEGLLIGLRSQDAAVAGGCARALIGWWRIAQSAAADQHFRQGLAAYEAQQYDTALSVFRNVEELGGAAPPDLFRMKAEALLKRSQPELALAECARALEAEPMHFAAYYVQATAYAQTAQAEDAVASLDKALAVYPGFTEARRLRSALVPAPEGSAP